MGGSRHAGQPAGLKIVPFTQRCEEYNCTFGVSRLPGFKDPTTEANVAKRLYSAQAAFSRFRAHFAGFPSAPFCTPGAARSGSRFARPPG